MINQTDEEAIELLAKKFNFRSTKAAANTGSTGSSGGGGASNNAANNP